MNKSFTTIFRAVGVLLCLLLAGQAVLAQATVSGTVKDPTGVPLPGVNVIIKGTTTGTTTDADGVFNLAANADDVLVISFIGYKTIEQRVGTQTNIAINLEEDIASLDEIVVVGYGEMRKSNITGAQTSISSKELMRTVNTSFDQALQGRSAGVYVTQNTGTPGGGVSVNIRGINSINGSNEPLYVIDGIQIQGGTSITGTNPMSFISPGDIENIEILQGPNATSIYGSRATNGVVMITTKRGKAGDMKINYNYSYSLQDRPKNLDIMNLREFAQMNVDYKILTDQEGTIRDDFRDPSLLGEGTDWQQALFQQAAMNKHQISFSGGSDKSTFYLSADRLSQEGIGLASGYDRTSFRLNSENKVRDWMSVAANVSYSQEDQALGTMGTGQGSLWDNLILNAVRLGPDIPVRNADGSFNGGDPDVSTTHQFAPANPVGLAQLVINDQTKRTLLGGVTASFKIIEGLEFRTSFNTNVNFTNVTQFYPTYRFSAYQYNNTALLRNRANLNTWWGWNQTLSYAKQFGKHYANAMFTHEAQESQWRNLMGQRQGFPTNAILDLNAGDPSTAANSGGHGPWAMESYLGRINYSYDNRYIVTATMRADGSVNFGPENKWGYFPSVALAYRISNENFFNVSKVSDLRLRFETGITGNQGNGGALYGTLAAGISPWGTTFTPARYPNPYYKWEETSMNNFGLTLGMFGGRIQLEADYYLKTTEALSMEASYPYYMGTNGAAAIEPPLVNIGTLQNNGWSVALNTVNINKGGFKWESNFNISAFKAEVTALLNDSTLYNRTLGMPKNNTPFVQRTMVGYAPWQFIGNVQLGVFTTLDDVNNSARPVDSNGNPFPVGENAIWVGDAKYKDINNDGKIDEKDLTAIGNPFPKFFGGFTNNLSYKGIELSMLITFSYGNDIYNLTRDEGVNPNNINTGRNMYREAYDFARIEYDDLDNPFVANPSTSIPRIQGNSGLNNNYNRYTSTYVEDGSYIRLKNISISYSLPSSLLSKLKVVKGIRVGASAQNLLTLTKYTGYDPEVGAYVGNSYNGDEMIGVDYGRYPITPVYSFSIGADF